MRRNALLSEYSKSFLRQYPIIKENNFSYFSVNPSFITLRFTSGLINEISGDKGVVRNEVGHRFETYTSMLLQSSFRGRAIKSEEQYGSRKARKHTPDLRVYSDNNELQVIVECKSTRLNFESKFDSEQLKNLPHRSDEIIKGFLQIWKYIFDLKNDKAVEKKLAKISYGLVVTLEPWIQLTEGRYQKLLSAAHAEADKKNIPRGCRIKVILTSIGELEFILPRAKYDDFLITMDKAKEPEFNGYMLLNVFTENFPIAKLEQKFDTTEIFSDTIWYWDTVKKIKSKAAIPNP